ncbi:MAG: flagellar biosynthesis regulator FlaF [Roseicyclus sp.]|jgi:flagellar protein FlaF|nr:flagellar biosynthesis regulator FlaF [Boseongicola sp. H5]MBO6603382.1 flagellar biosynthesis regulator FlaF [Roseicyclus sp.]MBO6625064.1 flagellar biosynthesis regulator FlaF [Roseicyclus sp.]MBO6923545.1 flagellar biosynthesis regulator FlaF [Roseicyclus sp.]
MARSAYAQPASPVRTDRGTEYAVFEKVTARLVQAENSTRGVGQKAAAIHDNRQLWTLLAGDVATEGNALPQALRAQIFYLCEFTLSHSRKVLKEGASLAPLIDINTAVMRGLRGEAEAA